MRKNVEMIDVLVCPTAELQRQMATSPADDTPDLRQLLANIRNIHVGMQYPGVIYHVEVAESMMAKLREIVKGLFTIENFPAPEEGRSSASRSPRTFHM